MIFCRAFQPAIFLMRCYRSVPRIWPCSLWRDWDGPTSVSLSVCCLLSNCNWSPSDQYLLRGEQRAKSESMIFNQASTQADQTNSGSRALSALGSLRLYWPEYLMEAGELGLYLFFTCAFATVFQHPASPVRHVISCSLARRGLYGLAMGSTLIGIVTTNAASFTTRKQESYAGAKPCMLRKQTREEHAMPTLQADYFAAYRSLTLTRDTNGVLVVGFHSNGGPFMFTAHDHTEFVDAFYRIAQDQANKIVILTGVRAVARRRVGCRPHEINASQE